MTKKIQESIDRLFEAIAPIVWGQNRASESVSAAQAEASWQVLRDAAERKDLALFEQLVAQKKAQRANLGNSRQEPDLSMLMAAAFAGETEVVRMLITAGADPQEKVVGSFSMEYDALSLAANKDHHEIVRLLVEAGANPNAFNDIFRPLATAVREGRLEIARLLIELGADPNAGCWIATTLLMEAVKRGHIAMVRLLLESGADLHVENNSCETALDLACAGGWVEIVRIFVEAGADVNRSGRARVTPLTTAATSPARLRSREEHSCLHEGETLENIDDRATQIVRILLNAGANPNARQVYGTTALLLAAIQGLTEMVRELLAANADVNLSDNHEKTCNTPLIAAIEKEHPEIARLLLDAGANYLEPNGHGIAPIDLASSKGLSDVVEMLRERGASLDTQTAATTALIGAARRGNLAALQAAISAGAVLDGDDREFPKGGLTALMYAAQAGHREVAEALIAAGADLNCHDARQLPWHKTALMYAAESNRLETVRLLLQAGANPNGSDRINKPGRTALMYAALEEHPDIVKALLDGGADATLKDRKGETALHYAYGHLAIVKMLLAAGADPYEGGRYDSPMGLAAMMGHEEIVRLMHKAEPSDPEQARQAKLEALDRSASNGNLNAIHEFLAAGVELNVQTSDGSTPLTTAVMYGQAEAVKILVKAGADPAVTDNKGRNALWLAIDRGKLKIARWLLKVGATLPENFDEGELLIEVVRRGSTALQMLLDLGVNVNACDEEGNTVLFEAIDLRLPEMVKMSIDAGIDLEKYGARAMAMAKKRGYGEIVAILENAGVISSSVKHLQFRFE